MASWGRSGSPEGGERPRQTSLPPVAQDENALRLFGLPQNPLQGAGTAAGRAKRLATPQTSWPGWPLGMEMAPTPPVPNHDAAAALYQQALLEEARNRVTAQDLGAAEARARQRELEAGREALPAFDPNDAAYHWNAVTPLSLGAPERAELPMRPAPGRSAWATGLAALAGLVDPRGAGSYQAAPLAAGIEAANTEYNDRLRQFAQAQDQMNAQYAAERADAEQSNRFAMANAEAGEAAAIRMRQGRDEAALRRLPYVSGAAEADALAQELPGLADRERLALQGSARAAGILESIRLADLQYNQALEAARYTNNPMVRMQVEALRQEGIYYRSMLRKMQREGRNAPVRASPVVRRPPVPTPRTPSSTHSSISSAMLSRPPETHSKSRYMPGNPNVPHSISIR